MYFSLAARFFRIPQKDLEDILNSSAKHGWQQAASFCLKMKRVTHLFCSVIVTTLLSHSYFSRLHIANVHCLLFQRDKLNALHSNGLKNKILKGILKHVST